MTTLETRILELIKAKPGRKAKDIALTLNTGSGLTHRLLGSANTILIALAMTTLVESVSSRNRSMAIRIMLSLRLCRYSMKLEPIFSVQNRPSDCCARFG